VEDEDKLTKGTMFVVYVSLAGAIRAPEIGVRRRLAILLPLQSRLRLTFRKESQCARARAHMRVHTYVKLFVDVICVIDAEADAEGIKSSPPFRLIRPMDRERFNNSTQRAPLCGVPPPPPRGNIFSAWRAPFRRAHGELLTNQLISLPCIMEIPLLGWKASLEKRPEEKKRSRNIVTRE